jgi:CRP/FNR family transcriptional regulator, cyclic AMP receptor protein
VNRAVLDRAIVACRILLVMTSSDAVSDLRRATFFAAAEESQLRGLAERAFRRRLRDGQVLFTEGEPSDHLFVVRSGRIRIVARSLHGDELVLSVLGPGEALGELSVIDQGSRSATAEALGDVELLAVAAADVRALLESRPALLMAAAAELAGTVRRLTGSAADLVFLDLPRRLAKLLLAEAAPGPDGVLRVDTGMSQSGLAARLGVTRQTLNRALAGLIRRGWVEAQGPQFVLRDPDALGRFADS